MSAPAPARPRKRHWLFDMVPLALCFALLFAVSFLPPDNSRYEVDRLGRLSVCMPDLYPPLVTDDAARPGFEVELLQEITERLGWRLNIVSNASMGRDFNPRNWRINRAQCQVLAGGIAINSTTSSFLDTTEPHLVTGWALIAPQSTTIETVQSPVGFMAGLTGLDRIGLGQYIRQRGITATIVNDAATLRSRLEAGDYDAAITEALLASTVFSDTDLEISVLGAPLERIPLGMGFWKGDLTLKRAVESTLVDIRADGTLAQLAERYDLDPSILCPSATGAC